MSKCHVCGASETRRQSVSEVFQIGGARLLVEGIPARVCGRCGEATFSRETTERIRGLTHARRKSVKKIEMEVLALT